MITFTATILKFGEKGEKTGWSYIDIPAEIASQLNPGTKTSFRVKRQAGAPKQTPPKPNGSPKPSIPWPKSKATPK